MENERSVAGDGKTKDCRVEGISKWISKWGKSSTVVIMGESDKKVKFTQRCFPRAFRSKRYQGGKCDSLM